MTLSVPPDRPVPEPVVVFLRDAARAAASAGVSCAVGGALGRELLLGHVFGEDASGGATEADLLVGAADRAAQERLADALAGGGAFAPAAGEGRRLVHGASGVRVALLPGGVGAGASGVVAAAAAAVPVAVREDLTVPVVALAAQSLLELAAWLDGREAARRDGRGLLALLRHYAAAGNEDRLYGEEAELLGACGFDPELAGGRLLARDAVRQCGAAPVRTLLDRMSVAHWRELSDAALGGAQDAGSPTDEARARELVVAYWDELNEAFAAAPPH
ncbi:MAG: hypothetical protein U0599_09415 [Vicinamibacteria bacterium]